MHKGIERNKDDSINLDLGNLDLLNLRLRTSPVRNFNDKGSGDNHRSRSRKNHFQHPLKKVIDRPNFDYLPQGYDRTRSTNRKLPSQGSNLRKLSDKVVEQKHQLSTNSPSSTRSVIRIKSQEIICEKNRAEIDLSMAYGSGEYSKNSTMEAMLSRLNLAGISGLDSIIGDTPVRDTNAVSSEYESKATSEILDPELNLGRLGYTRNDTIDWRKVKIPDKKDLYTELSKRITTKQNTDCTVQIGGEEFSCHFLVLQCYSELFEEYEAIKRIGIVTDECCASAFSFIYDWMINEYHSTKLNRDNVLDIFVSAKYLKIPDLVEQCWSFIDNVDVFVEDTAFLLYLDAKKKNIQEVKELMLPRIVHFFLMLVSSQDWLELDVGDVKQLLSSNYVKINCEMEIFMSAVRWLKHDWKTRDVFKYEIMDCVRFGNIAPWQLVDIKRNPENPEFMDLAKDPAICKLIEDGLAYIIIKNWYGDDSGDNEHWNSVLGLQRPSKRNWTHDDRTYFTYREFLIYLDQYRRRQMIEKSRPKVDRAIKDAVNGSHSSHDDSIPSMEDFLAKKKVTISTSTTIPKTRCKSTISSFIHDIKASCNYGVISKNESNSSVQKLLFTSRSSRISPESSLFFQDFESILIFGGIDKNDKHRPGEGENSGKEVLRYVPKLNAWEPVAEIPEARYQHKTAFFKGRVFLAGGCDPRHDEGDGGATDTVWSLDPVSENWSHQPNLNTSRKNFEMIVFNGNLYVIGGENHYCEILNSVESFNSANGSWIYKSPMKYPRSGLACVRYSNVIWAAGGYNENREVLDVVESYNVKYDQWTEIRKLNFPRALSCMLVLSDSVFLIGGRSDTASLNGIERWDSTSNQWIFVANLGIQRHGHTVGYIDHRIYTIGGFTTIYNQTLSNIECFCTLQGKWIRGITPLPMPLSGHAAVTLPPANLLLA